MDEATVPVTTPHPPHVKNRRVPDLARKEQGLKISGPGGSGVRVTVPRAVGRGRWRRGRKRQRQAGAAGRDGESWGGDRGGPCAGTGMGRRGGWHGAGNLGTCHCAQAHGDRDGTMQGQGCHRAQVKGDRDVTAQSGTVQGPGDSDGAVSGHVGTRVSPCPGER